MTITATDLPIPSTGARALDALVALVSALALRPRPQAPLPRGERLMRDAGIDPADAEAEAMLRRDVAPSADALRHVRL